MATKPRSFSPYSYGIIYRKPGESPLKKYSYIQTGGSPGPVYVISKIDSKYFCSIINEWYFNIDDNDVISFLKCNSTIYINEKKTTNRTTKIKEIKSLINSIIYDIKLNDNDSYIWINEKILRTSYNFNCNIDSVVLLNNEYIDNQIIKYYYSKYIEIDFNKIKINSNDKLTVIIYPIEFNSSFIDSHFISNNVDQNSFIDDDLNDKILIKNNYGSINYKYLVKVKNNKLINSNFIDILPSILSFDKNEINSIENINSVISYTPKSDYKTFVVQYQYSNGDIQWNNDTVQITHNFNSEVNFIIDNNDLKPFKYTVRKINKNTLEFSFNEKIYLPTVFSIMIFKIED